MKKNEKNFLVRISKESNNFLDQIYQKTKIPKSKILDIFLLEQQEKENNFLLKNDNNINTQKETEIRFKLTQNEKEFLEKEAIKSGAKSLTSEIKYRLLNTIYKNKFFTSNELQMLYKTNYEINMIGRNLNQLLIKIQLINKIENNEILKIIDELKDKYKMLEKEIDDLINFTDKRF